MQHILYIESAKRLGVESGCLALTSSDEQILLLHTEDVLAVVVETIYCQVSIPALLLCVRSNIPVLLCNEKHQPEIYCIDFYRNSELLDRLTQQINWSSERKCKGWIKIIHRKLQHQIELMQYCHVELDVIDSVIGYQQQLNNPLITEDQINTAESISARIYFKAIFGDTFKRFEPDTLNHALNYGYALLRGLIMVAITVKGLHPSLGIWHHSIRNRFNLADDLIEVLRPMVDYHVGLLDLQETFTKDHREYLLKMLYATVYWQGKPYTLRQAINLYLDDLNKFMMNECDIISPIELIIDAYEPD